MIGQEVSSHINMPEPDMQKYYDEHKSEFVRKEQVFLSQILISTEGKTPEQAAAAEKKAKDMVARARKGEKFTDLARENSDDPEPLRTAANCRPRARHHATRIEAHGLQGEERDIVTDPIKMPRRIPDSRVDERFEAGQASFEEVKERDPGHAWRGPRWSRRSANYLTRLRQQAFLEIKEGYVDSGAAPGKDTRWQDVAQLKPQTTTKEEVAARPQEEAALGDPDARHREGTDCPGEPAPPATPPPRRPSSGEIRRRAPSNNEISLRQRARAEPGDHDQFPGPLQGDPPEKDAASRIFRCCSATAPASWTPRCGTTSPRCWTSFDRDDFVKVKGLIQIFHNRPQLTIHKMRRMDDSEIDFADYFPSSKRDPDEMWRELRGIVAGDCAIRI